MVWLILTEMKSLVSHYLFNLFDAADELKQQEEKSEQSEEKTTAPSENDDGKYVDDHNTGWVYQKFLILYRTECILSHESGDKF